MRAGGGAAEAGGRGAPDAALSPPPPRPPPPLCAAARVACLVKLGGALITDKSKPETLRPGALRDTCRQLAAVYWQGRVGGGGTGAPGGRGQGHESSPPQQQPQQQQQSQPPQQQQHPPHQPHPPPPLVVVHGAGSFGHPTARAYGVANGGDLRSDARLREGFCLTRLRVSRLHAAVVEALVEAGVPATSLGGALAAGWGPTDGPGNVAAANAREACERVARSLDAGLVPVLYGDAVLDAAHGGRGCSVLGGDVLMRELARHLSPRRAVFLTDVDGVFDRPPAEEGARLVRAVRFFRSGGEGDDDGTTDEERVEWLLDDAGGGGGEGAISSPAAFSSAASVLVGGAAEGAADVSGGMRAKLEEAAAISCEAGGAPVVVARGGTDAALEALLRGAGAFLGNDEGEGGDGGGGGGGGGGGRLRATVVIASARRPRRSGAQG